MKHCYACECNASFDLNPLQCVNSLYSFPILVPDPMLMSLVDAKGTPNN